MRHWTEMLNEEREGFRVILDRTWEDMHPSECFDGTIDPDTGKPYYDIDAMCRDIDHGNLEWFMLRARVLAEGVELGDACVGGCLYEDPNEVFRDGYAEDLILDAMTEAKRRLTHLAKSFTMLAIKHS